MTPAQRANALLAAKRRSMEIACGTHLRLVLLAVKLYASDHDDKTPPNFRVLKDELDRPKLLFCPQDEDKKAASSWEDFKEDENASYQLLVAGKTLSTENTNAPVILCPVHGRAISIEGQIRDHGSPKEGSGKPLQKI